MLALLIIGVALIAFGAFVLVRMPTRPGGTVKTKWFEVSSVGAGLPLIVLGAGMIVLTQVDPFGGDGDEARAPRTVAAAARYFEEFDGDSGRVWFDGGAMYVQARQEGRRLLSVAQGVSADRFRIRATYVDGAPEHGLGLICRNEFAGRYYVLAISSDAQYNILEYENHKPRSLIGGFQRSGTIDRRTNTVEARCEGEGPVTLTLLVNGTRVRPPVVDAETPILRGAIGLRVGSPEPPVTLRFEDFQILD